MTFLALLLLPPSVWVCGVAVTLAGKEVSRLRVRIPGKAGGGRGEALREMHTLLTLTLCPKVLHSSYP